MENGVKGNISLSEGKHVIYELKVNRFYKIYVTNART